ncbi:ABC transporter substrate-binding protein [Chelatococcus reniformis]|uniref:Branched-chain amino acid ABC transporter substrate-binding protein n=1 Tax=Chelatococcus reniformis TaxID=1494448 RepID=A0A916USJ7_9HYPH|nr:ABC transporter substrate-binding protein [Chelatococcus reniformis]GGC85281.1 branched-chain amino acid ABC transporter substrate-binding protein [Chelatococcus reniformis]
MTVRTAAMAALTFGLSTAGGWAAEKAYGPGVSDTEIKLGQTMPYSGPASAYSLQGITELAYFKRLNERGGINGRKVNLISLDDGYSPPKTVEQTRKLVEDDEVLAIFSSNGTATNTAIHKYLNSKKVPQILLNTGAAKWNDIKSYPWTMAFYPPYAMEGRALAKHALATKPDAKIAILSQNDDYGRDYVKGFKEGLGSKAQTQLVAEATYETADATVDSQMLKLKGAGADTFFLAATPKFAAQAIRRAHELGWKPLLLVGSGASSIGAVLEPAGLDASQGLVTAVVMKTPADPLWKDDPAMKDFIRFMEETGLESKISQYGAVVGYTTAMLMHKILERAGDNLTRANLMKMVTSIDEKTFPMMLPGISLKTTPEDANAYHALRLQRFEGKSWVVFGDVITE